MALRALITFCSQYLLENLLSVFGLFPAHDPADPLMLDRMANLGIVAGLDPVGALWTTGEFLSALYCLQV
jgi:hypothetical protein